MTVIWRNGEVIKYHSFISVIVIELSVRCLNTGPEDKLTISLSLDPVLRHLTDSSITTSEINICYFITSSLLRIQQIRHPVKTFTEVYACINYVRAHILHFFSIYWFYTSLANCLQKTLNILDCLCS